MDEFSTTVNGVVAVDVVHRVDHLSGIDIGEGIFRQASRLECVRGYWSTGVAC